LWQTPWQDAYWVRSGATDGDHFVFSDYTGMHSIRARDGKMMWSVPLPPEVDPRGVVVSNAGKKRVVLLAKPFHHLAIGRQHRRYRVVLTSQLSNK
jgi:hypothetical protein